METTILECDLPEETCVERVRDGTAPDRGIFSDFGSPKNILSLATESGFRLRVREDAKRFGPRCFVKFYPSVGGTRIGLRAKMHPYPTIFMFIWLSGVVFIGGKMVIASVLTLLGRNLGLIGSPIVGVVGPCFMFAFGLLSVRSRWRAMTAAREAVISFLGRDLGARTVGLVDTSLGPDGGQVNSRSSR